jgi:lactate dehydrogenase-like 2-hydroxyacid dehydrogenase
VKVLNSASLASVRGGGRWDLAVASAREIPVGFTPGVLVETTADLVVGNLLAGLEGRQLCHSGSID